MPSTYDRKYNSQYDVQDHPLTLLVAILLPIKPANPQDNPTRKSTSFTPFPHRIATLLGGRFAVLTDSAQLKRPSNLNTGNRFLPYGTATGDSPGRGQSPVAGKC